MKTTAVYLHSLGCRTNQEEIFTLSMQLHAEGYRLVNRSHDADIIIINTCSVTGTAEVKTKRLIKSMARSCPHARLLVTGCLAQQIPEELAHISGVSWVVGNTEKDSIPALLKTTGKGSFISDFNGVLPITLAHKPDSTLSDVQRTRFPLKIQEGCDYRCGYCIVPLLRGPSRSSSKDTVLDTCRRALQEGYKEIVFTGTHIGQYCHDGTYRLLDLISDTLRCDGDFRIRLSSLDPRDCTDELIQCIVAEPRVCRHVHLSVQSLSMDVLAGMDRLYDGFDRWFERMLRFHEQCPGAGIGGDFIVGFPGETESMFEMTMALVKKLGFNYGHVFRFSKRPGTKAALRKDQIPEATKKERSDRLREVLGELRARFITEQYGCIVQRIIVESVKPVRGVTENYIHVSVPDECAERNAWEDVVLTSYCAEKNVCTARFCNKEDG